MNNKEVLFAVVVILVIYLLCFNSDDDKCPGQTEKVDKENKESLTIYDKPNDYINAKSNVFDNKFSDNLKSTIMTSDKEAPMDKLMMYFNESDDEKYVPDMNLLVQNTSGSYPDDVWKGEVIDHQDIDRDRFNVDGDKRDKTTNEGNDDKDKKSRLPEYLPPYETPDKLEDYMHKYSQPRYLGCKKDTPFAEDLGVMKVADCADAAMNAGYKRFALKRSGVMGYGRGHCMVGNETTYNINGVGDNCALFGDKYVGSGDNAAVYTW